MRILVANDALWGAGGVETYLATLVPALQAAGHEIGVLHDNPAAQTGPQRIAPEGTWRVGVQDEGGPEAAVARVRTFEPDVCFSHNMRPLAVDESLARAWPVVKMMHGHFGTCVSTQKAFSFPNLVECSRTFGPGCLAYYLPRHCGEANPLTIIRKYAWGVTQRSLFSQYRAIVVASQYMRHEYMRAGVAPDAIHAIPLFAPAAGPVTPAEINRPRPIDVLFLGRLTDLKGPDVVVHAAAQAGRRLGRTLSVVFAGEGPLRERLRDLAATHGVNASFPGWVAPPTRDRLLRDAAILAVPSRWPEPFGLVGLEAGVFGTPAVAFDTGGIRDWLRDGINGRLIDPSAGAHGMGDAIAELLAQPTLHAQMCAGARETAAAFTLDSYVSALTPVLAQAAANPVRTA